MSTLSVFKRCLRAASWLALGATLLSLDGCGVVALPCRLTAAALDILPAVGHAAATPFNACAAAID
ncbi:MAG TPA: DUF6726 family protein [Paraburkholderia sp.]|nr:DUF6726 family protein [Paraburkholderia sp.]